jgi:type II secretory pathway component GspD/PulD (secretin)
MGYQVRDVGGIAFFSKRGAVEGELQEIFVYRPVYRSVSYLVDLSGSVFRRDSFVTQRVISQESGSFFEGRDTGTNAFSMISKSDADVIVFRGTKAEIDKLRNLLINLDTPSGEILVKAVVYEVRSDARETNAVSLAIGLLKSINGIGVSLEGSPDSMNSIRIHSSNINAVWSALSSDSRFKLLSSPTVRIKSGGKARFIAGQEVPTLGSVSYPSAGQSVQSIDYKSSGVILEIQPDIREGVIELSVNQQISDFTATSTGVNNSPTLLKREIHTSVVVNSEEIIILGGLDKVTDSKSSDGLSFLPDFFKSSSNVNERTEIMMLLHVQRI